MKNKELTKEQKEILRGFIKRKNFDCFDCSACSYCSDCSDCSYMIKNVQFTKEQYEKFKKGEYTEEDLK